MPWKQAKDTFLRLPTRQEVMIITAFAVICLIVIAFFALTS